ncbi:MAG: BON domain-containing protein [Planctomycetota bacterium]
MKSVSSNLQQDVIAELDWDPSIDNSRIGVAVEKGVVVLTGHVRSLVERRRAEELVKRMRGVHAVVDELRVDLLDDQRRDDVQLATTVEHALRWNAIVPAERVKVAVSNGWVTLDGEFPFAYQREAAQQAVEHIVGVRGVTNHIVLHPQVSPTDLRRRLNTALHRYAQVEAGRIRTEVEGGRIVLSGTVRSWAERDQVQDAAWSAPGVTEVDNLIEVTQ